MSNLNLLYHSGEMYERILKSGTKVVLGCKVHCYCLSCSNVWMGYSCHCIVVSLAPCERQQVLKKRLILVSDKRMFFYQYLEIMVFSERFNLAKSVCF